MRLDKEKLINERNSLCIDIFALECSDDRLMTNGNGNKARYEAMQKRMKELDRLIGSFK